MSDYTPDGISVYCAFLQYDSDGKALTDYEYIARLKLPGEHP